MGTKAKRSSSNRSEGGLTAAQKLIAGAKQKARRTPQLNDYAVEHLRELCDYNDGITDAAARVTREDAAKSLVDFGWSGGSRHALDAVCREQLGRKSYSQAAGK